MSKRKVKIGFIAIILVAVAIGLMWTGVKANEKITVLKEQHRLSQMEPEEQAVELEERAKKQWKAEELAKPETQNEIDVMLNRRYEAKRLEDSKKKLDELETQSSSFKETQVVALRDYLRKRNPKLVPYAKRIVDLPRYMEVLAIAGHETEFCKTGVGGSKNNCGAIKGGSGFRTYSNPMDGLTDIAVLLQKPRFKNKSIAEMNGTYCVHEESATGLGKCPNWTENITKNITDMKLALYSRI